MGSIILESAVRTTGDSTASVNLPSDTKAILLMLDVTAAATDAGDILAVWLQGSIDGTTYYDIGRFADILGNGGAVKYIMNINRLEFVDSSIITPTNGSMTAGTVTPGPCPRQIRLKWTVTDAGTDDASFTFSAHLETVR